MPACKSTPQSISLIQLLLSHVSSVYDYGRIPSENGHSIHHHGITVYAPNARDRNGGILGLFTPPSFEVVNSFGIFSEDDRNIQALLRAEHRRALPWRYRKLLQCRQPYILVPTKTRTSENKSEALISAHSRQRVPATMSETT